MAGGKGRRESSDLSSLRKSYMGTGPCVLNHSSFTKDLIDGSGLKQLPTHADTQSPVALTVVNEDLNLNL